MPMDAYRKCNSFLIRLGVPGVNAHDVDLSVEDNMLTIRAGRPMVALGVAFRSWRHPQLS
jgi:HSP20 family protein